MATSDKIPLHGGVCFSRPKKTGSKARLSAPRIDQPDLFDSLLPLPRTHLPPEEVPLFAVANRQFSKRDPVDGWLYCVVAEEEALSLQRDGLPLCSKTPLMLIERPGLFHLFAHLSEEGPPEALVLLRMRKSLVNPWLENDPDSGARFGTDCYLLAQVTF